MTSGCEASGLFGNGYNTAIGIPNQPKSIERQGNVVQLPKGPLREKDVGPLILSLRKSEVANARAVRQAQAYHRYLQSIYRTPPPEPGLLSFLFGK